MVGTSEVLLEVRVIAHALIERLQLGVPLENLVAQVHRVLDVMEQHEVCNDGLGTGQVESVVAELPAKWSQVVQHGPCDFLSSLAKECQLEAT